MLNSPQVSQEYLMWESRWLEPECLSVHSGTRELTVKQLGTTRILLFKVISELVKLTKFSHAKPQQLESKQKSS